MNNDSRSYVLTYQSVCPNIVDSCDTYPPGVYLSGRGYGGGVSIQGEGFEPTTLCRNNFHLKPMSLYRNMFGSMSDSLDGHHRHGWSPSLQSCCTTKHLGWSNVAVQQGISDITRGGHRCLEVCHTHHNVANQGGHHCCCTLRSRCALPQHDSIP
jgi:hypothetical protein